MDATEMHESNPSVPLLGDSPAMQSLMALLPRIARAQRTTFLLGETGTGKELVAQALHTLSRRRTCPFVTVHCGAIPDDLFEAEMFGHVRGAFTGATRGRDGLVHEASSGTIFLDEVNSLSLRGQSKLLRFLDSGEYRPVGSNAAHRSGAWIIAASNEDLASCSQDNRFRTDLLYRLQAINVHLPPLRERCSDVSLLAEYFKDRAGGHRKRFTVNAVRAMHAHNWPGNVRELRNRVESAVLMTEGEILDTHTLGLSPSCAPARMRERGLSIEDTLWSLVEDAGMTLNQAMRHCESLLIQAALKAEDENRTRAAARLGIHVRTIFKKLAIE